MVVLNVDMDGLAAVASECCNRFPPLRYAFSRGHAFVWCREGLHFRSKPCDRRGPDSPVDDRYHAVLTPPLRLHRSLNRQRGKSRKLKPISAAIPGGSGAEPGAPCSGITSLPAQETPARACAGLVFLPLRARGHILLWTQRGREMMVLPIARVSTPSEP